MQPAPKRLFIDEVVLPDFFLKMVESHFDVHFDPWKIIPLGTLPKTNIAPENRSSQ